MDSDTVTEQTEQEPIVESSQEGTPESTPVTPETQVVEPPEEQKEVERVPLHALQKERKKRQEVEERAKLYEDQLRQIQTQKPPQEPDESQYDPVTKGDLDLNQRQIIRAVEEKTWIKQNPDKAQLINEGLTDFLKIRPNLASAIEAASNRYEEAWELMDKLSPRQQQAVKAPPAVKRDSPGSPGGIPKAAAMNDAVEVMSMSDSEFVKWRQSKRRSR